MRILMLTQLFQPEPNHLKGLAFARELQRRGHSVEVLTGFPNYPGGKFYPGYRLRLCLRENLEGVPVIRVPMYPSHDQSGFRRILCYSSLALSAGLHGIFRIQRPDVVHVYQGPATLAWPAMILRRLRGCPFVLDVQDLWPDSVASSGMLRAPGAMRILRMWCDRTYRAAARIIVLSEGCRSVLIERGVPAEKIDVVYNWCDEQALTPPDTGTALSDPFLLSGRFNVVYAGNIGALQALDAFLNAAALLAERLPQVQFVLVGDGVDVGHLQKLAAEKSLANVRFIPRQPARAMNDIFRFAEALFLHLKDDPLSRVGIPQKTQAYLAAGRPIVAAIRGAAAAIIRRAESGIVCEPENPGSIAQAIEQLVALPQSARQALGDRGRDFYWHEMCFNVGVGKTERVLQQAANSSHA